MKEALQELFDEVILPDSPTVRKSAFDHWKKRWIVEFGSMVSITDTYIANDPNVVKVSIENSIEKIKRDIGRVWDMEVTEKQNPSMCGKSYYINVSIISKYPQRKKEY